MKGLGDFDRLVDQKLVAPENRVHIPKACAENHRSLGFKSGLVKSADIARTAASVDDNHRAAQSVEY